MRISKYDIAVNIICILMLFGVAIYLGVTWQGIPDKIPGHYNAAGVVDRWGRKSELLILPITALVLFIGMTVLEFFPQAWNTGVTITAENRDRVYWVLKNMIGTMKLLLTAILTFMTINSALAKALPPWFLPVVLVLTFGSLIFFIVRLLQVR